MIGEITFLATKLHELNDNKVIKVKDKYPVLKTRKRNVINWWNSLNYSDKTEVGGIAIHYHKMTANYKWSCRDKDSFYEDLTKGQQKIVNFVFSKRNDNWFMFDIGGLIKNLN